MRNMKLLISLLVGTVIWYLAALFIRFAGAVFFAEQSEKLVILYILTPVTSLALLVATKKISRMNASDLYDSFVILAVTGAVLDGIAIRFFANIIYMQPPGVMANAAAWLLWAVGTTVFLAYGFKLAAKAEPKVL